MRRPGFTLIEMIVVLLIAGVLLGMTVPRLAGATGGRQMRSSVTAFKTELEATRLFALTRQTRCRLVIEGDSGRYHAVYQPDPIGDPQRYEPLRAEGARARTLTGEVRFAAVRIEPRLDDDFEDVSILFEPTGEADAAAIELTDGERTWTVRVAAATGRIELTPGSQESLLTDRVDLDAP